MRILNLIYEYDSSCKYLLGPAFVFLISYSHSMFFLKRTAHPFPDWPDFAFNFKNLLKQGFETDLDFHRLFSQSRSNQSMLRCNWFFEKNILSSAVQQVHQLLLPMTSFNYKKKTVQGNIVLHLFVLFGFVFFVQLLYLVVVSFLFLSLLLLFLKCCPCFVFKIDRFRLLYRSQCLVKCKDWSCLSSCGVLSCGSSTGMKPNSY